MTSREMVGFVGLLCISSFWKATLSGQELPKIQKKSLEVHIQELLGAPQEAVVDCGEYGIVEFGARMA